MGVTMDPKDEFKIPRLCDEIMAFSKVVKDKKVLLSIFQIHRDLGLFETYASVGKKWSHSCTFPDRHSEIRYLKSKWRKHVLWKLEPGSRDYQRAQGIYQYLEDLQRWHEPGT